jgi:hypothetical protein
MRRRSEDVGRIIRDILRICILPKELQGSLRKNARYLLIVMSSDPVPHWDGSGRQWVSQFTRPGDFTITIPMEELTSTAARAIGVLLKPSDLPSIRLKVRNLAFRPDLTDSGFSRYWGSLTRVLAFEIAWNGWRVSFEDRAGSVWMAKENEGLKAARRDLITMLSRRGPSGDQG